MPLVFHLAGINNQNFLMRDEQTGTYWQQITGLAISGPLVGRRLTLVAAEELSFKLWKGEEPNGTVLRDVPGLAGEYAPKDWDRQMARVPVVISYAQAGIKARDLMLGVSAFGQDRAFPYATVLKEKLVEDHMGAEPVLLVVGPDNRSVRVFRRKLPNAPSDLQFYRLEDGSGLLMDAMTGSRFDFHGCAVSGKWKGTCLEQLYSMKDYWFDWRNYHPDTSVYGVRQKIH
jgi:Protein of unknown function (DUF3179)